MNKTLFDSHTQTLVDSLKVRIYQESATIFTIYGRNHQKFIQSFFIHLVIANCAVQYNFSK